MVSYTLVFIVNSEVLLHLRHFVSFTLLNKRQFSWPIPIFFCKCDEQIQIFADSNFISTIIDKQLSFNIKSYFHNKRNCENC